MRSIAAPLSSTIFPRERQSQSQPSLTTVLPLPSWKESAANATSSPPSMEIAIGTFTPFKGKIGPWPPAVSPQMIVKRCQPSATSQSLAASTVCVGLTSTHSPSIANAK